MNNSTMIRYILLLILLLEIDVTVYGETKRPLLYETKHKFDHKGQNLKGNVFSVVTKRSNTDKNSDKTELLASLQLIPLYLMRIVALHVITTMDVVNI